MTFNQFKYYVDSHYQLGIREGQNIMNCLRKVWLDKYKELTGSSLDCFYSDHKISDTMNHLEKNWKEKAMDKNFNLEYDLQSNTEILAKARNSKVYSQNLYAALCNNRFFYGDKEWACSWRYAGGIIADMRQEGDYIDWYCSGIGLNETGYVGESEVTDEIRLDLIKMGWTVKPYEHELENKNV